ncbi:hypothetical protein KC678_00390 [Candidatus Dojkabacteria bacterium]|uniref:EF-hand domain-containing protein n=1 Tax=Candidatus Dojkabacteria bacterium TaxID=2099670 RepID=A0A955I8Q8_9BACT|nr:hypothetical protein [Candidatus Dojkabacteria bacterium]
MLQKYIPLIIVLISVLTYSVFIQLTKPLLDISVALVTSPVSTLDEIRWGTIYALSDGTDEITINYGDQITTMETVFYVQNPDGTLQQEIVIPVANAAGNTSFNLTQVGTYKIHIAMGYRPLTVDSTSKLMLKPRERLRTWDYADSGFDVYFNVENNTNFSLNGLLTENVAGTTTMTLYNPSDVQFGQQTLTYSATNDGTTFQTISAITPVNGAWRVNINTVGGSDTTVSLWLDGIGSYFSDSAANLFTPSFSTESEIMTIDLGDNLGTRARIGGGRIAEQGSLSTVEETTFNTLHLETTESPLNIALREPTNDDSDPNTYTSGINFTNQSIDEAFTVTNQPIVEINGLPAWYRDDLAPGGTCPGNLDSCLSYTETHAEFGEFVEVLLDYYINTQGYPVSILNLIDEPNNDVITATGYAAMMNTVADRLQANVDSAINSFLPYTGSITTLNDTSLTYIDDLISNINSDSMRGLGIHPWLFGHSPDGGTTYSTELMDKRITDIIADLDTQYLPVEMKLNISELNAHYGSTSFQDSVNIASMDHAVWWASALFTLMKHGDRVEAISYYPFVDDGSIHNLRGWVNSGGGIKRVGYATKFMLEQIEDNVLAYSGDNNPDINFLVTQDASDVNVVNILISNKGERTYNLSYDITGATKYISTSSVEYIDTDNYVTAVTGSSTIDSSDDTVTVSVAPDTITSVALTLTSTDPHPPTSGGGSGGGSSSQIETTTETVCGKIDYNGNGVLDLTDFANFVKKYSKTCLDPTASFTGCGNLDTDKNGKVDIVDFANFAKRYGQSTCSL